MERNADPSAEENVIGQPREFRRTRCSEARSTLTNEPRSSRVISVDSCIVQFPRDELNGSLSVGHGPTSSAQR